MRRSLPGTLLIIVTVGWGLEALASYLYLAINHLSFKVAWRAFDFPFVQWVTAFHWWGVSWWIMTCQMIAVLPSLMFGNGLIGWLVRRGFVQRKLQRGLLESGLRKEQVGVTRNHGDAREMTRREAARAFPGGGPNGGLAVAVWRHGDPPLIDDRSGASGHSMDIAGSGAGKTRLAILDMFTWTGPSVVLDPKSRIGPATRNALEQDGYRVIIVDPYGKDGFNAVDWILIDDPLAEQHVRTVIGWVFGDDPKEASGTTKFFLGRARTMCVCLLAHAIWEPGWEASLWDLIDGLSHSKDEMLKIFTHIRQKSHSPMARRLAATFLVDKAVETLEGIMLSAHEGTSWLSISAYTDMVSGNSFKTSDLYGPERLRVFIQMPMAALSTSAGVARVCIGALMNAMIEARGRGHQKEVMFLIDEAVLLGPMKVLETARAQGREYGIRLHLIWQSQAQIEQEWGRPGLDAWLDGVDWRMYSAVGAYHTAEAISRDMGKRGVLAYSEGVNRSRQSTGGRGFLAGWTNSSNEQLNQHEIGQSLMFPDQIMRMQQDEVIVISKGNFPLRALRPFWHDYPELKDLVEIKDGEDTQKPVAGSDRIGSTDPVATTASAP